MARLIVVQPQPTFSNTLTLVIRVQFFLTHAHNNHLLYLNKTKKVLIVLWLLPIILE